MRGLLLMLGGMVLGAGLTLVISVSVAQENAGTGFTAEMAAGTVVVPARPQPDASSTPEPLGFGSLPARPAMVAYQRSGPPATTQVLNLPPWWAGVNPWWTMLPAGLLALLVSYQGWNGPRPPVPVGRHRR